MHLIRQGISRAFVTQKKQRGVSCNAFGSSKCKLDWRALPYFCIFVSVVSEFNPASSQNNRLNFSCQGLSQQFCNCRWYFNNYILESVYYFGKFTGRNSQKLFILLIFPEIHTFWSPKLLAAFHPSGYQLPFFYSRKGTSLLKNAFGSLQEKQYGPKQSKTLVKTLLIMKLGFPRSSCQDFLRHGLSQNFCLCTKWSKTFSCLLIVSWKIW